MNRRIVAGVLAVILAAGSFGVLKGAFFARSFVHDQLAAQKITFAPYASKKAAYDALPAAKKFAGKQVLNGWEAKQYAAVIDFDTKQTTGGKTYSEISTLARTNPNDAKLQDARRTALDGQLLRGTLLNVYGWWLVGTIALWMGWFMVGGAVIALVVALLPRRKAAITVVKAQTVQAA